MEKDHLPLTVESQYFSGAYWDVRRKDHSEMSRQGKITLWADGLSGRKRALPIVSVTLAVYGWVDIKGFFYVYERNESNIQ